AADAAPPAAASSSAPVESAGMLSSMPGASLFASSSASPADAAGTAGRGGAVGEAWSGMLDTLRANLGTEQAADAAPPLAAASSFAPAESGGMLSSMPGASLFASSSASPADAAGTAGRGGAVGEAWSGMLDTLRANLGTEQAADAAPPPAAASSSAPAESGGMLSSMPGASLFASSSASPADAAGTAGRGGAVGEAWSGMLDTLRANLGTEQAADAAPTAAASSSAPPESAGMLSSMPGASLFASSSASPADAAGTAGTAGAVGEAWSGMLDKLRANLGTEQVKPSAPEGDGGAGAERGRFSSWVPPSFFA
ncbi:unnamed protein product, partial [Effrenium voratum]